MMSPDSPKLVVRSVRLLRERQFDLPPESFEKRPLQSDPRSVMRLDVVRLVETGPLRV